MPMHPDLLAIAKELNDVKKGLGPGTVVLASDIVVPDRITTGSLALDAALGGGWPVNQWHEIIGNPSDGKTTICFKTVAANQALNPDFVTVWLAAETYDRDKAAMDGVDNDRVLVINENIMENGFNAVLRYLESKQVDLIVIDSLPALTPGEEAEKAMEEFGMALGARLTNKFFRKQGTAGKRLMTGGERPCTGIVINQWRSKIGVMFGDPRTTPGGAGKDFAFYTRMEVRRDEWIEVGPASSKIRVGQTQFVRTTKNKSFPPQKVARWDYYFMSCTDRAGRPQVAGTYDSFKEIAGLGVVYGVIAKNGAWFSYGDVQTQGLPAFIEAISGDVALCEVLEKEVLHAATTKAAVVLAQDEDDDTPPTTAKPATPPVKRARPPKETPAPVTKAPTARRPAKKP